MRRTTRNRRTWLARVALGLAVAAVAAPSAQGMILEGTTGNPGQVTDGLGRPLDPAAVKSDPQVATVAVDTSKFRIDAQIASEPVRPDDRAVRPAPIGGVVPTPAPVRPDDRSVRPTLGDGTQVPLDVPAPVARVHGPVPSDVAADQPKTAPASTPSIDWNDAGIGIAIGVMASLVLLAGWMLFNRRRPDHFAGA